jgi:hypothetical protein
MTTSKPLSSEPQTGLAHNSHSTSVEFKLPKLFLPFLFTLALVGRTGRANTRRNCSHPAIGPLHCWPNPQRDETELMSLYLLLGFLHDEAGRLRRDIPSLLKHTFLSMIKLA